MIQAFAQTEVPTQDIEQRRLFLSQLTQCQAALQVCDSVRHALRPQTYANLPSDVKRLYEEAGLNSETLTNKSLLWSLQILELLISNNEQAEEALQKGRLVEVLGEVLILNGWG